MIKAGHLRRYLREKDQGVEENNPPAMDPLEEIELDGRERFAYVSSLLSNEEMEQVRLMLLSNIDVFALRHSDMVRINPTVAFTN